MKRKRSSRGETLAETLAAVLIVTLSSLVLATAAMSSARINRSAMELDDRFSQEQQTAERQESGREGTVSVVVGGTEQGEYPVWYYGRTGELTSYAYREETE